MTTELESEYPADAEFLAAFESLAFSPARFRHRDHVRIAWTYVTRDGVAAAELRVVDGIQRLAHSVGADAKYHDTMTRAWVRAVAHFASYHQVASFAGFIDTCPQLLRADLLLGHYSRDVLMSDAARIAWVQPDRIPIPA